MLHYADPDEEAPLCLPKIAELSATSFRPYCMRGGVCRRHGEEHNDTPGHLVARAEAIGAMSTMVKKEHAAASIVSESCAEFVTERELTF